LLTRKFREIVGSSILIAGRAGVASLSVKVSPI
jgi:hypothetical protein